MAASMDKSLEQIKHHASRINRLSDNSALLVKAIEAALTEANVGVTASIPVEINFGDGSETVYLSFKRPIEGVRLFVDNGPKPNDETRPWSDCGRITKLQTVAKLPELLASLENKLAAELKLAEAAEASVASIVGNTAARKGAK